MLGIDGDTSDFIDFLCSPKGEDMMYENNLSIHQEMRNIFCNNFNTQESFSDFLLNQQDKNRKTRKKKIAFYQTNKRYMHEFLQNSGITEVHKYDLYSNKNPEFLMYRYNAYLESTHQSKKIIRHTKKVNDTFSLEKSQSVN